MHKPMARGIVLVAALSLILHTSATRAGGGLTGGATEITQLLNHAELASSVAQQAQMVEQNVQAQITRLQQYVTMVQNLKQVPASLIDQTIAPYRSQITSFQSLSTAVTELQQAASATNGLFGRSLSEMNSTGMSPGQWLSAYTSLASTRGGLYQQQLTQDMQNLDTLAQRAQNLQQIQSQIPDVTGTVQGLQMLNQQSNVLAGEMVDLHALVQRQVAQQMQDHIAQSQAQGNTAQLAAARAAALGQTNQQEQQTTQGAPDFDLLQDQ
ncbi:conjugal transfer protein TrbJ [Paraburkholderia susongensis]|uniref:P-type conjugative transfer protein TrbJ n=1 Tax=Paraburkholderia susongensis TaxID=1515439 RepID=A0A1X7M5Q0_9BURK|nr:conjugal transfer protein TrbJ [Paraburkholderia susongensis]SMG61047.1 P-type conjugative transfer protein TrbJ [Paraburkholderia susongensis]